MSTTATTERAPFTNLSADGRGSWLPTWPLISTKFLELRKRRGLMIAVLLLTLALPVLVLGFRLLFHAIDPHSYGPAGSPSVFEALCDPLAQFGFIIAAALGATAGATDLGEGMFRHLVITGRSRVALYLARSPRAWPCRSRWSPWGSPSCASSPPSRARRSQTRSTSRASPCR